ncbi:MAG: glycosyltransferase family 4 protein [Acidobacteriia bacterium]|nr:glycosyltransferase family 4 protein [Terriglobia bacterium]
MKILIVHNTYQQPGGEDTVFRQERDLLRRTGHDAVTYERSNFEADDYTGLKRFVLVKDVIWNSSARQEFKQVLRREKPDVVHVHNTFMRISPSIYGACQDAGIPVVQSLHNYRLLCPAANFFRAGKVCEECMTDGLWRGVSHACYRESSTATATVAAMLTLHRALGTWQRLVHSYVALSEFSRQRFIAGGLPADKITVKPNFVDPDPGARTTDGDYAIFIGRFSEEKGLDTLLAAFEQIRQVPLIIVGDGPPLERLKAQADRQQLTNVSFRGRLPRHETWDALKGARFLVLPSECYENFPMTVAEAFACGVPVICSRLGAMQELVADHQTGIHFNPSDAQDLAAKVAWAWSHTSELAQMGRRARLEFEAKYTADKNYLLLMELYQRARGSLPAASRLQPLAAAVSQSNIH